MSVPITAIVLTYEEEANLPLCLETLRAVAAEIIVVDGGSRDRTQEIAREAGAQVVTRPRETQAESLNWALRNVPMKGDWILRLDADERLTPELAEELRHRLDELPSTTTGLYVKRRVHFMGRWIRHGGYYPTWILRAWRAGAAESEPRIMDEHMVLLRGEPGYLEHDIWEENLKGLTAWTERQNRYATREAATLLQRGSEKELKASLSGTPERRRRWLKQKVFLRAPPFLRAFLFFLYRYVLRLGFLDGKEGFIFHFLHGCWYRFLVDAKVHEARLAASRQEARQP